MKILQTLLLTALFASFAALPASGQGLGLSFQYGSDMQAMQTGLEVPIGIAAVPGLRLVPNGEAYFPDSGTGFALNGDVHYAPFYEKALTPYGGAGVGMVYRKATLKYGDERPTQEIDEAKLGANLIGGFEMRLSQHAHPFVQVEYRTGAYHDVSFGLGLRSRM